MPSWGDLLGKGSVAEQLLVWGVANQLIGVLLGPTLDLVGQTVNAAEPTSVLTPEALADAVVRGLLDAETAAAEAAKSGIDGGRFKTMTQGAGEPPGLETVLEMYRRKIIGLEDVDPGAPSVERAIKSSRVYDYWTAPLIANAQVPITVGEAVNALLRGQTDRATALGEAEANGIDESRFQVLLDSAGRPPSPGELVELLRRKLIPLEGVGPGVTSFQQGIFEGDAKDKWWPHYAQLAEYLPPPRTVTTLLKTGAITDEQAQKYWQDSGVTPELSAAYAKSARGEKLAGTRQLAESTVLTLYEGQAIDSATAGTHLAALGYDPADVAIMLGYQDLQRRVRVVNSGITRVGTLYVNHKITRAGASDALDGLHVTAEQKGLLLTLWDAEAAANVKQLTMAEVVSAWEYQVMSTDEALTALHHIGYTAYDAWVLLSNKAKSPLPGKPPVGQFGPGVVP